MIRAVIFDHDDVLAQTEQYHCSSTIQVLSSYGFSLSESEYYDFWVRDGGDLSKFVELRGISVDIQKLRAQRRQIYHSLLRKHLVPMNGSDVVVRTLHPYYSLAVASSSYGADISLSLDLMNIRSFFREVVTIDDVSKGKPDPQAFFLVCERLCINPGEVVVLDDAQKGITAAHRAGMKSIAIPTDRTRNHDFSLATLVLDSIRQVTPDLIKSL